MLDGETCVFLFVSPDVRIRGRFSCSLLRSSIHRRLAVLASSVLLRGLPLACKAVSGLARDFLTFKHLTLECSPTSSIRYGCSLHLSPFTFLESCPGPCPGPCLLPWAPPSLCTPSHPAWVLLPPCRLSVCCLEVGPWASPAVCVRPSQTLGPVGLPPATDAFFTGFSVCSCLFLFYGNVRLRWSSPCPTIRDE